MSSRLSFTLLFTTTATCFLLLCAGCLLPSRPLHSPTSDGINTNHLIDPAAQASNLDADRQKVRSGTLTKNPSSQPGQRHVLCLSGGGAYGAYTVGVLSGWSQRGDRPCFDVVTGISTGALIAPFAFLGSNNDPLLQELYTTIQSRDIYRLKPVTGIFSESFASNRPLKQKLDEIITPEFISLAAREHQKGRRLYIGTTEAEGKRFVVWDVGAIASRGRPDDKELICQILLASTAIPGIFPSVKIPVTVNGQPYCEMHVDGTVTQSIFYMPPADAASQPANQTRVYAIVAGKLYADPEPVQPRSVTIAVNNLISFSYAHTRGDLWRIWSLCQLTGRSFYLASMSANFQLPQSMTTFDPQDMQRMFQDGYQQMITGTAWRNTPPGVEHGEEPLIRSSTDLLYVPRTPSR